MFKKAILQNKKTNERKEFRAELEFKNFLVWQDKSDEWQIIDLQFEQKPQVNNKKTKSVGNGERFIILQRYLAMLGISILQHLWQKKNIKTKEK